jgi:hypothetical protein
VAPGNRLFKERVEVDRLDFDLALSYFFPDVVRNVLDVSTGLGFKFIYASADREIVDYFGAGSSNPNAATGAFYCTHPTCSGATPADRGDRAKVSSKDYLYGLTVPTSLVFQLSADKRWLLPFNVSPFIGAENRDDEGVAYDASPPSFARKRQDGTTFAYGVTSDLNLRYVFANGIAPYIGFRVQYINGHEEYLAWGPLAGVSFRFGGR